MLDLWDRWIQPHELKLESESREASNIPITTRTPFPRKHYFSTNRKLGGLCQRLCHPVMSVNVPVTYSTVRATRILP